MALTSRLDVVRAALTHGTPAQKARARWLAEARPEQLPPPGDWDVFLYLAGRGTGKTRAVMEWLADRARAIPASRWAIVAATFADGRDTCVEGESGLLAVAPDVERWNRSNGELTFTNGSRAKVFSAQEPDRLRGPQHHGAVVDELAAWEYPETWDQLQFGLRLGAHPQVCVATTPRPTELVRALYQRGLDGDGVVLRRGSTFDNAKNLSASALAELRRRYEGSRLGRQELYAELLTDVPGALWTMDLLDATRLRPNWNPDTTDGLVRVVVGVDPAVSTGEHADETGIVVAGLTGTDEVVILDDCSLSDTPERWGQATADAFVRWRADRVVAEANQGGDLVTHLLTTIDRNLPVTLVHATRGKRVRAEPVAALSEQGRLHLVGSFPVLEDQMCTWSPTDATSPDHLDACVWAVTELMFAHQTASVSTYEPYGGLVGSR
ncbi:MAG: DNA-packaging protein [Mycobacterium sp.]|nr:DNA-packaging protein [Mycobacterium sp.]